jgi:hypothetical protein
LQWYVWGEDGYQPLPGADDLTLGVEAGAAGTTTLYTVALFGTTGRVLGVATANVDVSE